MAYWNRYLGKQIAILLVGFAFLLPATTSWAKKVIRPTTRAVEHNNRGAALLNDGKLDAAEFELKTAVQLSPDYAEAFNNLGIVYKQRKQYDLSLQMLRKAASIDKDYVAPLAHIGAVYMDQGKFDKAIKILEKAVKKEPTFAEGLYNLGLAYLLRARERPNGRAKKRDFATAEKILKTATQLKPHFSEANQNLGDLYLETGQLENAEIRYRLAIEDNPSLYRVYRQLALVLQKRGKVTEANKILKKGAITKLDQTAQSTFDRGLALMNEGENLLAKGKNKPAMVAFKRAVTELGKALRIKPNSPEIHYALGVSYQRLAKTNQAVKEWEKTLKLQPQHPGALFNMGSIAHKKMHTSEAIYYWCSFLSIAGRNYPSQRQLILKKFRADGLQCPN